MKTKEAIEYLNKVMGYDSDVQCVKPLLIIELLKRGEKFEKMFISRRRVNNDTISK